VPEAVKLLDRIPGVGATVAQVIVSEIGVEMEAQFPTDQHLRSWGGMCPENKESAGKRESAGGRRTFDSGDCRSRAEEQDQRPRIGRRLL